MEHGSSLLHDGAGQLCVFGLEALRDAVGHLRFECLVEGHVVPAHKFVALFTSRRWGFAIAESLPCHHRLADVDATVVDDLDLHHIVAGSFEDARDAVAQKVVPQVAQVKGLVGVG